MDPEKIALLIAASGLRELSPETQKIVQSDEFWDELEATPEDKLTKAQLDVLAEMGVNVDDWDEENEDRADDE